jgi:hypothetical protein
MATPKIVADFNTQISSAIAVGSTSFTLLSVTDDDGVSLVDGLYYFTVDSGSSNKEYFTGTLTVATKTLASVKSVSRQGIEASGAVRAHRVGSAIKITDFATYKVYIDQTSLAGVSNATTSAQGVVELATQAEVDAGTATGATGASIVATPAVTRAKKYNDYAADAGGTDAYAITVTPAITAYATGQVFTFKANTANTGAATLNVNALGAITIKKYVTTDLATGDILVNQVITVVYDGTNFQLISYASTTLNTYAPLYSNGTTTRATNDASSVVTVAHGLGVIPKRILLSYGNGVSSTPGTTGQGTGCFDSSGQNYQYSIGGSTNGNQTNGSGSSIVFYQDQGFTKGQTCVISVDATNITFTWTRAGSGGSAQTAGILWTAEY